MDNDHYYRFMDVEIAIAFEGWPKQSVYGRDLKHPHYNTDTAATIRAIESWVDGDPSSRRARINIGGVVTVEVFDDDGRVVSAQTAQERTSQCLAKVLHKKAVDIGNNGEKRGKN